MSKITQIHVSEIASPAFQFDLRVGDVQRANSRILKIGSATEEEIDANFAIIQHAVDNMLVAAPDLDVNACDWSGVFPALEAAEAWCSAHRCNPRAGVSTWPTT